MNLELPIYMLCVFYLVFISIEMIFRMLLSLLIIRFENLVTHPLTRSMTKIML
jgi:hypothetical protein